MLFTSSGSDPLIFGDDKTQVDIAALVNWFWGLLTTVMILRSTLFRRPNELGYRETNAWPWMTLAVTGIWVAAGFVALNAPTLSVASDSIIIPVGAILAIPVATALTSYTAEFLIQGFAARNAGVSTS